MVIGLPLVPVPCRRPIIRSSVIPPFLTRTMESQSPLEKFIKESGRCVGPVKHLLIGDMFCTWQAQYSSIAPSFKDVDHVLY